MKLESPSEILMMEKQKKEMDRRATEKFMWINVVIERGKHFEKYCILSMPSYKSCVR